MKETGKHYTYTYDVNVIMGSSEHGTQREEDLEENTQNKTGVKETGQQYKQSHNEHKHVKLREKARTQQTIIKYKEWD